MKRPPAQPGARWAFMRIFKVKGRDVPTYLWRLRIIQTPWFGMFLHKLGEKDYQDPHDHPWTFFYSFILRGSYWEGVWTRESREAREFAATFMTTQRHGIFCGHKIASTDLHRIYDLKVPTWTLIFVGRRIQQWGFMTQDGWVPWDVYLDSYDGRVQL